MPGYTLLKLAYSISPDAYEQCSRHHNHPNFQIHCFHACIVINKQRTLSMNYLDKLNVFEHNVYFKQLLKILFTNET